MQCEECKKLDIPEHLCLEGKALTVPFTKDELLFRRYSVKLAEVPKDTDLKAAERLFALQDDSYNRSSLSTSSDALIDENGNKYPKHGVLSIPIDAVNSEKLSFKYQGKSPDMTCHMEVHFDPKDCNYAHAEIRCFVDGTWRQKQRPVSSVKPKFRRALLDLIKVEIPYKIETD